jgi:pimeloyl-ACP methyl ester carboxylesterase
MVMPAVIVQGTPERACHWPAIALAGVLLAGCAADPAIKTTPLAQQYPQLPEPDMTLNIAGLGPCNDDPDRSLHLNSQQPVTLLVHGCTGSSGRFRTLSEVLAFHGQQSACFSYDDRDSMIRSSRQLSEAVGQLAAQLTLPHVTVIGHSQGGLVARKAFIDGREDTRAPQVKLQLVTVSAPLSGIRAARSCGMPLVQIGSLGLNNIVCWLISGDKWYEITAASDFINKPGALVPSVERYLLVATDEEDSCRQYDDAGRCVVDDFVFTLDEQELPPVDGGTAARKVEVRAGHVEIVGEPGVIPAKLIQVLQQEGYIQATEPARTAQFNALLARLYGMYSSTRMQEVP